MQAASASFDRLVFFSLGLALAWLPVDISGGTNSMSKRRARES
jgi:hypothetical protein